MRPVLSSALVLALLTARSMSAAPATIASDALSATVDTAFPRVMDYRWKATGATMAGTAASLDTVRINGTNYQPKVVSSPAGASALDYRLTLAELNVEIDLRISVAGNVLDYAVTALRESGSALVHTLAVPDLSFIALSSDEPGATVVASRVPDADVSFRVAEAKAQEKPQGFTHVVATTEKLAASLWNNVLLDGHRIEVWTREENGRTVTRVGCPAWTWREIPSETVERPVARVVFAADENGDGAVDWQDGAIAYRAIEPKPYGAEFTRGRVVSQIAMNFASQAQHPFLSVLDSVKKVFLYTDGLGQEIQFKGYQTEGHDSSHPDYGGNVGRRQGGRDGLNCAMSRMKDFHARAGVHINATEYYPEARHYSADLVDTNKKGWAWLDQSYYTDQRYDLTSGKLYRRLDEMKADLPELEWVYVDVYFGTGWNARQLARKINTLGWTLYTEFPGLFERYGTWNHTAQDWTQKIWGDGRKSRLARFIQHQDKDTWAHDPLLRGSNNDGFLGWHSQRDLTAVIRSAFAVNLPSKYLQHFAIRRWTDARIDFEGGVRAEVEDGVYRILRGDRLLNTARYPNQNQPPVDVTLFMPWDPVNETRIYHWNDAGGATTWDLPPSWAGAPRIRLYRLTDTGRVFVQGLPARAGKVTIEAAPRTPYVLYKDEPPRYPEIEWGENAPVKDPGFDSHSFAWWTPASPSGGVDHVQIANDPRGQTHLRIRGNGGAAGEVSQPLFGLEPGRWYSAGVWLELEGARTATMGVRPWPGHPGDLREAAKKGWRIVSASSEETSAEKSGAAHAIDGDPATLWHSRYSGPTTAGYPHELVVDMGGETDVAGLVYLARQTGGANGTVKRFAFFLSADGAEWGEPAAEGEFAAVGRGEANRVVLPAACRARFLKFVARSEIAGQDFGSAAEIGVLLPRAGAGPAFRPVETLVRKTNVMNYQDNGDKYLTYFQRAKVVFQAPADGRPVELFLRANAGAVDAAARFDDARVVATAPPDARGHAFYEDFENVDQYWGPFVYGFRGSTRVHLAEAHPPFTDDVVDGRYSLKVMDEPAQLIFRSTPALLPLKPDTRYTVAFDYLCDNDRQYALVVRSDDGGPEALNQALPGQGRQRRHFEAAFTTGGHDDYWIGVVKRDKEKGILSLDNLAIDVAK